MAVDLRKKDKIYNKSIAEATEDTENTTVLKNDKMKTQKSVIFTATARQEDDILKSSKADTDSYKNNSSIMKPKSSACTISFVNSEEEVHTKKLQKTGYPISSWAQFWILLKRTLRTIIRDKQLTHSRLISHVVVGALIAMIYYDTGEDESKVMSNAGFIFFTTLFIMFTAMMPTILTCK